MINYRKLQKSEIFELLKLKILVSFINNPPSNQDQAFELAKLGAIQNG
tara:strand:- start:4641 stop:4784 length:144 start_codon:yes stop_codon:yes gene_type:complete